MGVRNPSAPSLWGAALFLFSQMLSSVAWSCPESPSFALAVEIRKFCPFDRKVYCDTPAGCDFELNGVAGTYGSGHSVIALQHAYTRLPLIACMVPPKVHSV